MKEMLSQSSSLDLQRKISTKPIWKAVEESAVCTTSYTKLQQCSFSSVREGDTVVFENTLVLRETCVLVQCHNI